MNFIRKIKDKLISSGMIKFFMRNVILMESNPDFSDNTRAVFDELIRRKVNEKNKIIWFVQNSKEFEDIKIHNVYFYARNRNKFDEIRFKYYNLLSKYIIDCNVYIQKLHQYQFRIHLTHGEPIKDASDYFSQLGKVDYLVQTSAFFNEYNVKSFGVSKEQILDFGFPRNDELLKKSNENLDMFPDIKKDKIIMWMPTYRNHKAFKDKENDIYNMKINFKYGVPAIENEKQLFELNEVLKVYNVLLVIKLHPVEDSSKIQSLNLSNIKLVNDRMLSKNNHNYLYQYLYNVNALITDYSSVYFDFLLTKKPIAMAIPDIEEYKKHVKLLFSDLEEELPAEYIYSFNDLKRFVINVANGNDMSYNNRMEKIFLYHSSIEGNSTTKVVEHILDKMEIKGR